MNLIKKITAILCDTITPVAFIICFIYGFINTAKTGKKDINKTIDMFYNFMEYNYLFVLIICIVIIVFYILNPILALYQLLFLFLNDLLSKK